MHPNSPQANGWESARDEGARLLEQRNFEAAIEVLHEPVKCDRSGQSQALMGLQGGWLLAACRGGGQGG